MSSRRHFIRTGGVTLAALAAAETMRPATAAAIVPDLDGATTPGILVPTAATSRADNPHTVWEWKPWDMVLDAPSPAGFHTVIGGAAFRTEDDEQWDPVMYQGYNVADGGALANPAEPGAWWALEANYLNPSGARWIESYFEIRYGPEQGEQLRPLFFVFDRDANELQSIIFQSDVGLSFNDTSDRSWGNLTPTRLALKGSDDQESDTEIAIGSKNGRTAQLSISSDRHESNFVLAPSGAGQWSTYIDGRVPMRLAPDSVVFGDPSSFDGVVTSRVAAERVDAHANYTAAVREEQTSAAFQIKYGRTNWGTNIQSDGRVLAGVGDPHEQSMVDDGTGFSETPVFSAVSDQGSGMAFPTVGEVSLYAGGTRVARLRSEKPKLSRQATVAELIDVLVQLDLVELVDLLDTDTAAATDIETETGSDGAESTVLDAGADSTEAPVSATVPAVAEPATEVAGIS